MTDIETPSKLELGAISGPSSPKLIHNATSSLSLTKKLKENAKQLQTDPSNSKFNQISKTTLKKDASQIQSKNSTYAIKTIDIRDSRLQ